MFNLLKYGFYGVILLMLLMVASAFPMYLLQSQKCQKPTKKEQSYIQQLLTTYTHIIQTEKSINFGKRRNKL